MLIFGLVAITLIASVEVLLGAWALLKICAWYGLSAEIGFREAAGVILLAAFLTHQTSKADERTVAEKIGAALFFALMRPFAFLLLAWVVRLVIRP